MLRCTVNNSNRKYSGWFTFFVVDGWFFLGTDLIFLGTFFLWLALLHHIDDIAHT
jgi:hypothetical protein